jgi:putative FmdB family regulatory protein
MPTYEYQCTKCGIRFELFQPMADKPRRRCPECRGKVLRLISGGAGVLFKGSGFHATDYRSHGYTEAAKKDKPAEAKPDSSPDTSGGTKKERTGASS